MTYSATLKIQPNTLTDLTVNITSSGLGNSTLTLSDFTVVGDNLEASIEYNLRDTMEIISTGYQTQTLDIYHNVSNIITLNPLEFSNIETNSIKYYCKDEVARNSITSIATDLNNKAGTDLANVTDSAKVMMAGMGMPSNRYIDLTLGASGSTYTAPANGYYNITWLNSNLSSVQMYNDTAGNIMFTAPNVNAGSCFCPVKKGDRMVLYYVGSIARWFRFYYAQGSKN